MKPNKARVRVDFDNCPIMDIEIVPKKKNLKSIFDTLNDKLG